MRRLVVVLLLLALTGTAAAATTGTIAPLDRTQRRAVLQADEWHHGCPVAFSGLRVLSVRYHGFDRRTHWGKLVVAAHDAPGLRTVFATLYALRFPIHHMQFGDTYGSLENVPKDGDFTASFECRQAASSPCTKTANGRTGSWSMHAYGEAIDLNPVENPYVGCGMTRDKTALSYLNRSNVRRGMVTPAIVAAFAAIGWGWGGAWSGSTKDYMHFSANGH